MGRRNSKGLYFTSSLHVKVDKAFFIQAGDHGCSDIVKHTDNYPSCNEREENTV